MHTQNMLERNYFATRLKLVLQYVMMFETSLNPRFYHVE